MMPSIIYSKIILILILWYTMPTPEMYSDNGNEDVLDLYIVSIYI